MTTIIIDGSNAVRGESGYDSKFPEQDNFNSAEFAAALSEWAGRLRKPPCVEVVFDGGHRPLEGAGGTVFLFFSGYKKADDIILERIRYHSYTGGRVFVVTGDGELAGLSRAEGAQVRPPSSLRGAMIAGGSLR